MSYIFYIGLFIAIVGALILLFYNYTIINVSTNEKPLKKMKQPKPPIKIEECVELDDTPDDKLDNKLDDTPDNKLDDNTVQPVAFDYLKPSISQITKNVFLSDCSMSFNHSKLESLGITHMIVVGDTLKIHDEDKYKILHIKIDDSYQAKLKQHFDECDAFIADNKTLVYCVNGVSRSATIVVAHLMKKNNISNIKAIEYIKKYRPIINIEDNFLKELQRLECELNIK
jgi:protein-tyrosine phosphatase